MKAAHAKQIAGVCNNPELEDMLLDERLAYFACHEMEKTLKWEERKQYHGTLADVAGFSYSEADTTEEANLDWTCRVCHATASQRCEAFLRVKGLWVESGVKS